MKTEYKILRETGGFDFNNKVIEATKEGWRPVCIAVYERKVGMYHAIVMKRTWTRKLLSQVI